MDSYYKFEGSSMAEKYGYGDIVASSPRQHYFQGDLNIVCFKNVQGVTVI